MTTIRTVRFPTSVILREQVIKESKQSRSVTEDRRSEGIGKRRLMSPFPSANDILRILASRRFVYNRVVGGT
jgi:hypothetical protein